MESCKTGYGNPMRQKIARQIEREIKANIQIKQSVIPEYIANGNNLKFYEGSDRGPDFVRCALKSCELLKILHLSLPDNMIGEKEIADIAYVLKKNTPLKVLNLSNNVIDPKAALLLSEALSSNSNLRELDLSCNKLGNAGVAILAELFVKQKLQKHKRIIDKQKAIKAEEKAGEADKKKRVPKIKTKLEKLMLDNNTRTVLALKHVYTILIANPNIEITIDLPDTLKNDTEESEKSDASSVENDDGEFNEIVSGIGSVHPLSSGEMSPNDPRGLKKGTSAVFS